MRHNVAGGLNARVLAILAVIFICGAAFGSVITREYLHSKMWGEHKPPTMEAARNFGLTRLKTELNLTPEQMKTVTRELDEYAKYYQNIQEQYEDVADHGKQRILDVLDDQQKKRFNEICGGQTR
jgi:ribosomal protein S17E